MWRQGKIKRRRISSHGIQQCSGPFPHCVFQALRKMCYENHNYFCSVQRCYSHDCSIRQHNCRKHLGPVLVLVTITRITALMSLLSGAHFIITDCIHSEKQCQLPRQNFACALQVHFFSCFWGMCACSIPDSFLLSSQLQLLRNIPTNNHHAVSSSASMNVINCVDAGVIIFKITVV